MKPTETWKGRAAMNSHHMKRAITGVLVLIMAFFAVSVKTASAGAPEPLFYAVTTQETRVRGKTSKTSALIVTVQAGTEVSVLEEVSGRDGMIWYRIQLKDGTAGYARNDFFRKTDQPDSRNANPDEPSAQTWKEAYAQYLTGDGFQHQKGRTTEGSGTYWTDCFGIEYLMDSTDADGVSVPVGFALYDWDLDGVPELFSYDGRGHKAGNYYAYTYRNGGMAFSGKVGNGWSCGIVPYRDEKHHVLFSAIADGYSIEAEWASLGSDGMAELQTLFGGQIYDMGDNVPEVWEVQEGPADQELYDLFISRYTYYADFGNSRMQFTEVWGHPDDAWFSELIAAYPSNVADTPAGFGDGPQTGEENTDADDTPDSSAVLFYAATTKETRIREKANKDSRLVATLRDAGTEVSVLEEVNGREGKIWFRIRTQDGVTGYARGDFFIKTEGRPESGHAEDNGETNGWSGAYENFVMNQVYAGIGEPDYYFGEFHEPIQFAVYDLDNDGIPELFASNGEGSTAGNAYNVYTYRDDRIQKAGNLGERELLLSYDPAGGYPGLLESEGSMGIYYTEYWYMENNQIMNEMLEQESYYSQGDDEEPDFDSPPIVTRETADQDLYNWAKTAAGEAFVTYTYDDISRMGWEKFISLSPRAE